MGVKGVKKLILLLRTAAADQSLFLSCAPFCFTARHLRVRTARAGTTSAGESPARETDESGMFSVTGSAVNPRYYRGFSGTCTFSACLAVPLRLGDWRAAELRLFQVGKSPGERGRERERIKKTEEKAFILVL